MAVESPPALLYRLRPLKWLLEGRELAHQEIYFEAFDKLNDPMEGARDLCWQGDRIAWENLFKHYLRCLGTAVELSLLIEERQPIRWGQIPVVGPFQEHYGDACREEMLTRATSAFFRNEGIGRMLDCLAEPGVIVRREELRSYCCKVHLFALSVLWSELVACGLLPAGSGVPLHDGGLLAANAGAELAEGQARLRNTAPPPPSTRALFTRLELATYELSLIDSLSSGERAWPNRDFIFRGFPFGFPDQLERVVYPDWRVACFMAETPDASLWGTYGENHTGVCLIFQPILENERALLPLKRVVGWGAGGPVSGTVKQPFHRVTYSNRFAEIDFFRSIGRLPAQQVFKHWHSDGTGRLSSCAPAYDDKWRQEYWSAFYPGATTKLEDWAHEQEYRLVLPGLATDFSKPESCKATYDFANLAGLVLGMRTPLQEKLDVLQIVTDKCRLTGRQDFRLYEARYSEASGRIEHVRLSLVEAAIAKAANPAGNSETS